MPHIVPIQTEDVHSCAANQYIPALKLAYKLLFFNKLKPKYMDTPR